MALFEHDIEGLRSGLTAFGKGSKNFTGVFGRQTFNSLGHDRDKLKDLKDMKTHTQKDFRIQKSTNEFTQRSFKIEKSYFTKAAKFIEEESKRAKSTKKLEDKFFKDDEKHTKVHLAHMKTTEKYQQNVLRLMAHQERVSKVLVKDIHDIRQNTQTLQAQAYAKLLRGLVGAPLGVAGLAARGVLGAGRGMLRGSSATTNAGLERQVERLIQQLQKNQVASTRKLTDLVGDSGYRPDIPGPQKSVREQRKEADRKGRRGFLGGVFRSRFDRDEAREAREEAKALRKLERRGFSGEDIDNFRREGTSISSVASDRSMDKRTIGQKIAQVPRHPIAAIGAAGRGVAAVGRGVGRVATTALRFAPGIGAAVGAGMAAKSFSEGDYFKGAVRGAGAIASILPGVGPLVGLALEGISELIPESIQTSFNKVAGPIFQKLWKGVGGGSGGFINMIGDALQGLGKILTDGWRILRSTIFSDTALNFFKSVGMFFIQQGMVFFKGIKSIFGFVADLVGGEKSLSEAFFDNFKELWDHLTSNLVPAIGDLVVSTFKLIKGGIEAAVITVIGRKAAAAIGMNIKLSPKEQKEELQKEKSIKEAQFSNDQIKLEQQRNALGGKKSMMDRAVEALEAARSNPKINPKVLEHRERDAAIRTKDYEAAAENLRKSEQYHANLVKGTLKSFDDQIKAQEDLMKEQAATTDIEMKRLREKKECEKKLKECQEAVAQAEQKNLEQEKDLAEKAGEAAKTLLGQVASMFKIGGDHWNFGDILIGQSNIGALGAKLGGVGSALAGGQGFTGNMMDLIKSGNPLAALTGLTAIGATTQATSSAAPPQQKQSGPPSVAPTQGQGRTGDNWSTDKAFVVPVAGKLSSGFGPRNTGIPGASTNHKGQDIAAPQGTSVKAAMSGTVMYAGNAGGYGNLVILAHPNGMSTRYAHLANASVKVGDKLNAGDILGAVGSTGTSSGPHLHFEVRQNGQAVDPAPFLKGVAQATNSNAGNDTTAKAPSGTKSAATQLNNPYVGGMVPVNKTESQESVRARGENILSKMSGGETQASSSSTSAPTTPSSGANISANNASGGTTTGQGIGDWSAYIKTPEQQTVFNTAMQYAQKFGWTPEQTRGFMGLLAQESGFKSVKGDLSRPGQSWGPGQMGINEAKQYGFSSEDRLDPVKGTAMSAMYFNDILKSKGGNVSAALKRYNGGGDPNYLQNVGGHLAKAGVGSTNMAALGTGAPSGGQTSSQPSGPMDIMGSIKNLADQAMQGLGDLPNMVKSLTSGMGMGDIQKQLETGYTDAKAKLAGTPFAGLADITGALAGDAARFQAGLSASIANMGNSPYPGGDKLDHTMGRLNDAVQQLITREDPVRNVLHGPERDPMVEAYFRQFK